MTDHWLALISVWYYLDIGRRHAAVAQLVEQRIRNAWVGGSNPFRGTIINFFNGHWQSSIDPLVMRGSGVRIPSAAPILKKSCQQQSLSAHSSCVGRGSNPFRGTALIILDRSLIELYQPTLAAVSRRPEQDSARRRRVPMLAKSGLRRTANRARTR
jgi:hypothetical protein